MVTNNTFEITAMIRVLNTEFSSQLYEADRLIYRLDMTALRFRWMPTNSIYVAIGEFSIDL